MIRYLGRKTRKHIGGINFFHKLESNKISSLTADNFIDPIFIIGVPRSGSTLLYDVLINKFRLSYIPNIASVFYKYPYLITSLFWKFHSRKNKNYNNDTGFIPGIFSPSEAGKVLEFWFDDKTNYLKDIYIKKCVIAHTKLLKGPFINKNTRNSLRIDKIIKIFPKALFIYIDREPLFVIQSLLLNKNKIFDKKNNWIALDIQSNKDINDIKTLSDSELTEELVRFIKRIKDNIENNLFNNETTINVIKIKYSDFCHMPNEIIHDIKSFYTKNNFDIECTNDNPLKPFVVSNKKKLSQKTLVDIEQTISRILSP